MGIDFVNAKNITPVSSSTDQILIAETQWGWDNIGIDGDLSVSMEADVAQRGDKWIRRGNLSDISGMEAITSVDTGATFAGSPDDGDVHVFSAAATGLSDYEDASGTSLTTSVKGDVAQYDGTNWIKRGDLTDIAGVLMIAAVSAGTSFPASPTADDILIFNADATGLSDYESAGGFIPDNAPAGITTEPVSANESNTETDTTELFYEHQPRIVEGGLRRGWDDS